MGSYKSAEYYNEYYSKSDLYKFHYSVCPYYELWKKVMGMISIDENILEVGCGSGQLSKMLLDNGFEKYIGFDFSSEAIKIANSQRCIIGDCTKKEMYDRPFDTILCLETLEHLKDDIEVIRMWPKGKKVILTVPDFDYESHTIYFQNMSEIVQRYQIKFNCFGIYSIEHFGHWFIINGVTV